MVGLAYRLALFIMWSTFLADGPNRYCATMVIPDLTQAVSVLDLAGSVIRSGIKQLVALGGPDVAQVLAYDLAHAASGLETARSMIDYGAKGETEGLLTCAFVADVVHDLAVRLIGREELWGVADGSLSGASSFLATYRDPEFLATLATSEGPRHLDSRSEERRVGKEC